MFKCFLLLVAMPIFSNGSSDTLLPGQSLFTNQTLVSKGGKFELGFFSPGNSTNYYLGMWYKHIPVQTVVWVYNRDRPILHSHYNYSRLEFFSNGSLYFYLGDETMSILDINRVSEAFILDTGNFVLRNGLSISFTSFDQPTDTWLPGMKLYDTGYPILVSWRNPNDPACGNYSLVADSQGVSVRFNFSDIVWVSGALQQIGAFPLLHDFSSFRYIPPCLMYDAYNESAVLRMVVDYLGRLTHFGWSDAAQAWSVLSSSELPEYGVNIVCDANWPQACRCLDGFAPPLNQDFNSSVGCLRITPLRCAQEKPPGPYVNMTTLNLPTNPHYLNVPNYDACNLACSQNCSCSAYFYGNGGQCLLFVGDISALGSPTNDSAGLDLFLRTESPHAATQNLRAVALILPITAALVLSCFFFSYQWRKITNTKSRATHQNLLQFDFNSSRGKRDERSSQYELPKFSLSSIAASTNNFSIANKLGEGGFGPVYKGELLNGQFVAVKRLSRRSGQVLEEFQNETELIAKLQHRNLVGILGCCTENDEMILVYEYMPNKSLDSFLFEPSANNELLDWKRRRYNFRHCSGASISPPLFPAKNSPQRFES